jgi:chaperonin GroEL
MQAFYGQDARDRVLAGAQQLYDAVSVTMGVRGRNVVIDNGTEQPVITHDGVTVAKMFTITETAETIGQKTGANLIKQAANKLNDVAGDGTTTVTVLTYHILNEANKLIAAGHNPMELRQGIELAVLEALAALTDITVNIEDNKAKLKQVASISAGDAEIGAIVADVVFAIGKEGVVTVEESNTDGLTSEIVKGFTFTSGYISPYFMNDPARQEAVYSDPYILLTDEKIFNIADLIPIMEQVAKTGVNELVIIAEGVENEALSTLVLNKMQGTFNTVAVQLPGLASNHVDALDDIANATGATVISRKQGRTMEEATLDMLGRAKKIIVTKSDTTIVDGAGKLNKHLTSLKAQVDLTLSVYGAEHLRKRIAALSGKVAVIKVGGVSATEIEEKRFRVDDAVCAAKAALEEGIVPGGGMASVALSKAIQADNTSSVGAGKAILKNALLQPFTVLMSNAGEKPDHLLPKALAATDGYGFDLTDASKLVDLFKAGIVDPAKVTREALQNSASIAGTAITMGALLVNEVKREVSDGKAL